MGPERRDRRTERWTENDKKRKYWTIKGDSSDRKPEMTFLNEWKEKEIAVKAHK